MVDEEMNERCLLIGRESLEGQRMKERHELILAYCTSDDIG